MFLKTAFFQDGFNRIVTHKIFESYKSYIYYDIINSKPYLDILKYKKLNELYFIKIFTMIIIFCNWFWPFLVR